MKALRNIGALFYLILLEMIRTPTYLAPTIIFPAFFYLIFAVPEAFNPVIANVLIASFAAFGVFGVVFFQFGVGIADERYLPWGLYFRTLPVSPTQFMIARSIVVLFCAALATALICFVGFKMTPVALSKTLFIRFLFYLFLGALPLAAAGIAFGFWVAPRSALPMGVIVYLPVSYLSGLWKPPDFLPLVIKKYCHWYPTGRYARILWDTLSGKGANLEDFMWLGIWGVIFIILAWIGYVRDDLQRFK